MTAKVAAALPAEVRARIREGVISLQSTGLLNRSLAFRDIYVLECGEFVKVGYASNLKRRVAGMLVHNPFGIHLVCRRSILREYATAAERGAHWALEPYRHRGEWFRVEPAYAAGVVHAACQETRRLISRHLTILERERIARRDGAA